jgi:hypothetical protein
MVAVSEYVGSIILIARVIAVVANVVLFYPLIIYMLHSDDIEPRWQTNWIRRLGRTPLRGIIIFVLWWFFPLVAVVFAPEIYRTELLYEILVNQPMISLPFAPLLLMVESGHVYREMKRESKKAD